MDLQGKNVVYVADCGGLAYETCKILLTRNIGVNKIDLFYDFKFL